MKKGYDETKIFMIEFTGHPEEIIISYTTEKYLSIRLSLLRSHYRINRKNNIISNNRLYSLFDKYGFDDAKIKLLEDYPCNNINQIKTRIEHWLKEIPNSYVI
jgi:hypothetical protein